MTLFFSIFTIHGIVITILSFLDIIWVFTIPTKLLLIHSPLLLLDGHELVLIPLGWLLAWAFLTLAAI